MATLKSATNHSFMLQTCFNVAPCLNTNYRPIFVLSVCLVVEIQKIIHRKNTKPIVYVRRCRQQTHTHTPNSFRSFRFVIRSCGCVCCVYPKWFTIFACIIIVLNDCKTSTNALLKLSIVFLVRVCMCGWTSEWELEIRNENENAIISVQRAHIRVIKNIHRWALLLLFLCANNSYRTSAVRTYGHNII